MFYDFLYKHADRGAQQISNAPIVQIVMKRSGLEHLLQMVHQLNKDTEKYSKPDNQ